jgi:hypothetical protein
MLQGQVLISERHIILRVETECVCESGVFFFSKGCTLQASFKGFLVEEGNLGADARKEVILFFLL